MTSLKEAGDQADNLIDTEVAIQDAMWGDANDRADATKNQLLNAAIAQAALTSCKCQGLSAEDAVATCLPHYPPDWNGFRDYGSNVANLVVAAAYLRSEIKRRIVLGEDTTRTKRGEAYKGPDFPAVSSDEAAANLG